MIETANIAIDADRRTRLIERMLALSEAQYVFPDAALLISRGIRERWENGQYDELTNGIALRDMLTAHLQEISRDKHLCIFLASDHPASVNGEGDFANRERRVAHAASRNFGFYRVERLNGNIGYWDLRFFADPAFAGAHAIAAMTLVSSTDAMIVDLRQNSGGRPNMVAFLCSFFLDTEPTHLNNFYLRPTNTTQQSWSTAYLPCPRFVGKPLYVLTSSKTLSGAEEFAYDLKNLKRATVVGETIGGAAHPGAVIELDDDFTLNIPWGRAISPITGTDWEATGVEPDIAVPTDNALATAYQLALTHLLNNADVSPAVATEARDALDAFTSPVSM